MAKLEDLQKAMAAEGVDALLITDLADAAWLTGFTGSSAIVLVTGSEARFLSDSRYTLQSQEEVKNMPSFTFANPVSQTAFLAAHAAEMGIRRLSANAGDLSHARWQELEVALTGIELVPAPAVIAPLRMVKTEDELISLRKACQLADACFEHVRRQIQPGVVEFDLGLEIEFFFRRHGADLAFHPIVVSGLRSARPHGRASENRLQEGDFLTMDFGALLDGMCSDITRTVVVGEASDRHREVYDRVLKAQLAAMEVLRPGALASDVDKAARDAMGDMAQYFGHGLGHGLGGVVHDLGRLGPTSKDVITEGQVWTVEPGIYIEGFGGVRIEDDVLVTSTGIEVLTHSPKDLLILP